MEIDEDEKCFVPSEIQDFDPVSCEVVRVPVPLVPSLVRENAVHQVATSEDHLLVELRSIGYLPDQSSERSAESLMRKSQMEGTKINLQISVLQAKMARLAEDFRRASRACKIFQELRENKHTQKVHLSFAKDEARRKKRLKDVEELAAEDNTLEDTAEILERHLKKAKK